MQAQKRAQLAHANRGLLADPVGMGMALFLISETFLFFSLFAIYYYLRGNAMGPWPPEGVEPHLAVAAVNSVILLSSSVTSYLAVRAIRRGNVAGLISLLVATIALGAIFFGIKMYEWSLNSFGPWDHAYGSIYYTLTGMHGLHVLIGLLVFGALLVRARAGCFSADRHLAVEVGSLYWHFVDVVWLFVFTTVYLVR